MPEAAAQSRRRGATDSDSPSAGFHSARRARCSGSRAPNESRHISGAAVGIGFDGVAFNSYYPPDANISVSPTQIVQTTNVQLAVYDKTGGLLKGPVA
jgi:hypothetical protein